jgi:hypothetical protein
VRVIGGHARAEKTLEIDGVSDEAVRALLSPRAG